MKLRTPRLWRWEVWWLLEPASSTGGQLSSLGPSQGGCGDGAVSGIFYEGTALFTRTPRSHPTQLPKVLPLNTVTVGGTISPDEFGGGGVNTQTREAGVLFHLA